MELRPAIMLQSVAKSLTDIIIPAVDPDNKLAQEQSRLILGLVQLAASQLPLLYRYDRHELDRLVKLADALTALPSSGTATTEAQAALETLGANAADVLDRARAEPSELDDSIHALRSAIGALVQATQADGNRAAAAQARAVVLAAAKEQLERERAWVVRFGFEADPSEVAPIETLLDPVPKTR
jgi:hypothetical protein